MEETRQMAIPLLQLINNSQIDENIRVSASLYFKNYIKRSWEQTDNTEDIISPEDRVTIKQEIINLMINQPKSMQLQIGEAVSIIADNDFPSLWPNLIKDLVSHFSPTDVQTNNGILQTAHMVFNRYRSEFRSDMLFTEIKYVLSGFAEPYYQVFLATTQLITKCTDQRSLFETLDSVKYLLIVFYDLNCQDLPEFFEDRMEEFMKIMHTFLLYNDLSSISNIPNLPISDDDDTAGILEEIKAEVLRIVHLYTSRYEDEFKQLPIFLETIWNMLTTLGLEPKYDGIVIQGLKFLTAMVKNPRYKQTFLGNEMIDTICQKIVLRNIELSTSDEELFEDDPIMYVRRELEGYEADSRRNASSELVRGMLEHYGTETTQAMLRFIMLKLEDYSKNPSSNWKSKDDAVFMVSSISTMASVKSLGVTQTNNLVDLNEFYQFHMLPHLVNLNSDLPILKSDAIKYIYVFRNQLSDSNIESSVPLLIEHISHPSAVVSTFASLTLERLFVLRKNNVLIFNEAKVLPYAQQIFDKTFSQLISQPTPEKLAENDFYAKLIMRVIISTRSKISSIAQPILTQLCGILEKVCKNPSNPIFNHYLFESIGSLSRYTCIADPSALPAIESTLFPLFQLILESEISDFMPYVFQILSQLLLMHNNETKLTPAYAALLQPLLQPALWDYQGNIPALVKLLTSYFSTSGTELAENGQLSPVLGIFQKLIGSKANDHYAFELLNSIVLYVPLNSLKQYLKAIFMLILNRLQVKKTPKYVRLVTKFVGFFSSIDSRSVLSAISNNNISNLAGEYVSALVGVLNEIQPQLLSSLLSGVLVSSIDGSIRNPVDIKYVAVGYTCIISNPNFYEFPEFKVLFTSILTQVIKLIEESTTKVSKISEDSTETTGVDPFSSSSQQGLDGPDINEAQEIFQSSFSKLSTLEGQVIDPCSSVSDPRVFIGSVVKFQVSHGNANFNDGISLLAQNEKGFVDMYFRSVS
ncbi:Exportin-2 [Smittium mucronatum]|uniref:Exportin-2 n=1 Tax=Smittium mucronatum TaxID=133383 RepID=A0A1R0H1G2_9FUNG|nr:Exportin-2 [Smittium mucronatum]